jgi:uncharacterized cupin superfamily protein
MNSGTYPLQIPLPPPSEHGWQPHRIFRGTTPLLETLTCHASALARDRSPHAPHRHEEEELLILLVGEVELRLPDDQNAATIGRRLTQGQLVFYPAGFAHSLRATSHGPANYLMFKWRGAAAGNDSLLPFGQFEAFERTLDSEAEPGFHTRLVFEGPTAYLGKLHCHASTLTPGAGYEPHVDAHDVAILILEGEVETLGKRVGPHSVIFYRAGEAHGLRNPGRATARYLVFEFHGPGLAHASARPQSSVVRPERPVGREG